MIKCINLEKISLKPNCSQNEHKRSLKDLESKSELADLSGPMTDQLTYIECVKVINQVFHLDATQLDHALKLIEQNLCKALSTGVGFFKGYSICFLATKAKRRT
jgi:hypothetical protein